MAAGIGGVTHIGLHIGPPKTVNRLLRVTHADQGSPITTRKEFLKKGPLQAVCVLGLVHDGEGESLHQREEKVDPPFVTDQVVSKPQQIVVAGLAAGRVLHPFHAFTKQRREFLKLLEIGGRQFQGRPIDPRLEERISQEGRHQRSNPVLIPAVAGVGTGHDDVVNDFSDNPLTGCRIDHSPHVKPGRAEHPAADAMDRGDGGGVELRDGPFQAFSAGCHLAAATLPEPLDDQIACRWGVAAEGGRRFHQPPPHAIAKFCGRIAGEGGDQDLPDSQVVTKGQFPRHQGCDGVRLARASTGLDNEAMADGVVGQVKRCVEVGSRHRPCGFCCGDCESTGGM